MRLPVPVRVMAFHNRVIRPSNASQSVSKIRLLVFTVSCFTVNKRAQELSSATPTGGTPGRRNIIPRAYCTWYVYPPQTSTAAQARQRERAGSACARELSPKHQTDPSRHTRPDATSTPRAAAARAPVESWGTQIRMLMCWRCRPSQHHGVVAARPFSTRSALP